VKRRSFIFVKEQTRCRAAEKNPINIYQKLTINISRQRRANFH